METERDRQRENKITRREIPSLCLVVSRSASGQFTPLLTSAAGQFTATGRFTPTPPHASAVAWNHGV